MPLLETALSVGGGLLKGIFGARSARKARRQALEDQRLQFVRLRDAAEAAGFNPLTALRANPAGGMVNPTPALASGEFVADALSDGVSTYFNAKQRERDIERDAIEKALMREELRQMQAQGKAVTSAMGFGYAIPQANNYTGVDRANSAPDLMGLSGASGGGVHGGLHVGPLSVKQFDASNAEDWEKRYGDVASSAIGIPLLALDAGATFGKYKDRFWWERMTERRQNVIDGTHYSGGKVPRRTGSVGQGIDLMMSDDYEAIFGR